MFYHFHDTYDFARWSDQWRDDHPTTEGWELLRFGSMGEASMFLEDMVADGGSHRIHAISSRTAWHTGCALLTKTSSSTWPGSWHRVRSFSGAAR